MDGHLFIIGERVARDVTIDVGPLAKESDRALAGLGIMAPHEVQDRRMHVTGRNRIAPPTDNRVAVTQEVFLAKIANIPNLSSIPELTFASPA